MLEREAGADPDGTLHLGVVGQVFNLTGQVENLSYGGVLSTLPEIRRGLLAHEANKRAAGFVCPLANVVLVK